MTNEEAIAIIRNEYKCVDRDCDIERSCGKCDLMMPNKELILEAYKLAIKALEQQPITTTNNDEPITVIYPTIVCDDAISRENAITSINKLYEECEEWRALNDLQYGKNQGLSLAIDVINDLPPVTQNSEKSNLELICEELAAENDKLIESLKQKSGKWDRLYSWLNDMRLGIAPDETVTDIDERHCRESQTDILDEIMEWMIKAEVEPQESEEQE